MKTPTEVVLSRYFQKRMKKLRKHYPHVKEDVQPLIEYLSNGETPGDQLQGIGFTVYKVRLPNRDIQRGKSGGYRVIYYIRTEEQVILLTIYAKVSQADISMDEINAIIADLDEM